MKRWWPSIGAGLIALLGSFQPQIQGLIVAHPAIATTLISIYAVLSHLLPSPIATT